jgi:molybdate transport system ATP-binding protein
VLASDVSVALAPVTDISILNQLPARVLSLTPNPEGRVLLMLGLAGGQQIPAQLSAYSVGQLQLEAGSECYALVKAAALVG